VNLVAQGNAIPATGKRVQTKATSASDTFYQKKSPAKWGRLVRLQISTQIRREKRQRSTPSGAIAKTTPSLGKTIRLGTRKELKRGELISER